MRDLDRDELGAAHAGVVGDAQQRSIAQGVFVTPAALEQVGKTYARGRAVEIGNVALEVFNFIWFNIFYFNVIF